MVFLYVFFATSPPRHHVGTNSPKCTSRCFANAAGIAKHQDPHSIGRLGWPRRVIRISDGHLRDKTRGTQKKTSKSCKSHWFQQMKNKMECFPISNTSTSFGLSDRKPRCLMVLYPSFKGFLMTSEPPFLPNFVGYNQIDLLVELNPYVCR